MKEIRFTKIFYFACFVLTIGFVSCSEDLETHSVINVGEQYEIQLNQTLSEDGGLPTLDITTLEPQMCTNTHISLQTIISEQKIKIFLNDLFVEGECIPGNHIISEEVLLETQKQAIPFEISLKNAIDNKGMLHSGAEEFELVLNQFDGLKISKTHINRVQPGMLWGSYSISDDNSSDQLTQYIHDLNNGTAHLKGDYGLFYLAQDDAVNIYNSNYEVSFLISTNEAFHKIKSRIQEFKDLDSSLNFEATNYNGSTINIH